MANFISMKTNPKFVALLVILLAAACSKSDIIEFEVVNRLPDQLDSVRVCAGDYSCSSFVSLPAGEKKSIALDLSEIPKVDGHYVLTYQVTPDGAIQRDFGYYTHGFPLEKWIGVEIHEDTVLFTYR